MAFQSAAEGPAINAEARIWVTWRTEDVRVARLTIRRLEATLSSLI